MFRIDKIYILYPYYKHVANTTQQ